jgi:uncharacterized protein
MIENKTKKLVISDEKKICESTFSKMKGLMFTLKPKALVFVNNNEIPTPIHMMFMFYPIDVIWLDKDKKVVHIQKLKPWQFSESITAKYVVELPEGKAKGTSVGNQFTF